jgi:hypothetical protein
MYYRYDSNNMWRYFHSPSAADGHRQSTKRVSMTDSAEFSGDLGLSSGRVTRACRPQVRQGEAERFEANSIEMKIWAILFALIILAAITLIAVVLMEEPGHVHAVAQSLRSWIA